MLQFERRLLFNFNVINWLQELTYLLSTSSFRRNCRKLLKFHHCCCHLWCAGRSSKNHRRLGSWRRSANYRWMALHVVSQLVYVCSVRKIKPAPLWVSRPEYLQLLLVLTLGLFGREGSPNNTERFPTATIRKIEVKILSTWKTYFGRLLNVRLGHVFSS